MTERLSSISYTDQVERYFDPNFYVLEYDELELSTNDALVHFVTKGWLEARHPSSRIDTWTRWRSVGETSDIKEAIFRSFLSNENPAGASSYRLSAEVEGYRSGSRDTLERIVSMLIEDQYYVDTYFPHNKTDTEGLNFAHHFLAGPCRDLKWPCKDIDEQLNKLDESSLHILGVLVTEAMKSVKDDVPISVFLGRIRGSVQKKVASNHVTVTDSDLDLDEDQKFVLETIASRIDSSFYLGKYADVRSSGISAALHYAFTGWQEGRDPTPIFETRYYLRSNVDVREAGVNPFYHYIVQGESEGRLARRPGSAKRRLIEDAEPVRQRYYGGPDLSSERKLSVQTLAPLLNEATKGAKGVVLSVSHDCYVRSVGGTQIFIADEAANFSRMGISYIHISPTGFLPRLRDGDEEYLVQVVVDGKYFGVIGIRRFAESIAAAELPHYRPATILHVLLGHSIELLTHVLDLFGATDTYLWLHDYSTVCTGFNLLRNDVEFCGGPPLDSMACRVCIHGEERKSHVRQIQDFFRRVAPVAISPSDRAAEIWHNAKVVDSETILVIPHLQIEFLRKAGSGRRAYLGTGWNPIRVGFVGYPSFHKGWSIFEEILALVGTDPRFEFFHFASARSRTYHSEARFVPLEVTSSARFAAVEALRQADIDIIVNPSPWPETFSYVLYETIAAGALTYTLSASGNVAATVSELGLGTVFDTAPDLTNAFTGDLAVKQAKILHEDGKTFAKLIANGTTAAIFDK